LPYLTHMKRRLQGQRYFGETIERQDLRSMSATGSIWEKCRFVEAKLSLADFSGAQVLDCEFVDCEMHISCFQRGEIRRTSFLRCDMEQSLFGRAVLDGVKFSECRLALASFYDATVRDAEFSLTNLSDADLRYIECNQARYNDVVLWNAQVSLGCQFFKGTFDERSVSMFVAMASRIHPDPVRSAELAAIAGNQMALVDRMMRDRPRPESHE
jgi:uncharacterized protein YjbI with pentapeptide repeats